MKADNGITFSTLLFLVFLILKLTNYISWSWWWVMSPIWIPASIAFFFLIVIAVLQDIGKSQKK